MNNGIFFVKSCFQSVHMSEVRWCEKSGNPGSGEKLYTVKNLFVVGMRRLDEEDENFDGK